jgi:crotonobetainyl-CoA:carnitine CoA-transferase CaiB-like acyl-CoA transferase
MPLPLDGLRVVALEQAVAAPFCSRNLCDMGADVVKIEPLEGDFARKYDTVVEGEASYFVWLGRGKRSVALNLRTETGRQIMRRLVLQADVLVHNLAPGTPDRLGLDYDDLRRQNRGLIWAGISGYGTDGPYRDRKGFDLLLQGEAGIIASTGSPEAPAKVGFSIADACSGFYAFTSILLALLDRQQSGQGRRIDISILDCLAEWMMPQAYYAMYRGRDLPRAGMRHNIIVPYGPYQAGDGRGVNLAIQTQGQWERFCAVALGRADLATDPRFDTNEKRVANRSVLEPLIESLFADFSSDEVVARLEQADVPFGRLNNVTDLVVHPQLTERGRLRPVELPAGQTTGFLPPFNIEGLEPRMGAVPRLGQHTREVLAGLGYGQVDLERLQAERIIGTA